MIICYSQYLFQIATCFLTLLFHKVVQEHA